MPRKPQEPITYLITSGATTNATTAARMLHELAARAASIARGSATSILVNDRADIARTSLCDGVHLTTQSLDAGTVRRAFGEDFLIGVSTHTLSEARAARDGGADFAVFGPVFDTPSKRSYGPPLGVEILRETARALAPFPLVALGGITEETVAEVFRAGARGVAAIRLFASGKNLARTTHLIESLYAL
jgi:thiamine-phosphate pyrophosphorylase